MFCCVNDSMWETNSSFSSLIGFANCLSAVRVGDGRPDGIDVVSRSGINSRSFISRRAFSVATTRSCSRSSLFSSSISFFSFSSFSTSRRLRSRDDWAACLLRRTRSTRRCSFSSSVLARFLRCWLGYGSSM